MLSSFAREAQDRRASNGERPAGPARCEPAFDALFRAHYPGVLRYALTRSANRAAAEDIAAETFVIAWRRLDALPADELPWLLGIARHLILNERRSDRRRLRLMARLSEPGGDAGTPPSASSTERSDVLDALARLGERDQEVLRLAAWEGLDAGRAAAVLGCSRGAFAVRLHRARRRLARQISAGRPPRGNARADQDDGHRSKGRS